MKIFGVDVSYYNGNINWTKVKNAGVQFAILRLGYTGYGSARTKATDVKFEEYYKGAKAVGMPVGGYWFSCACSYNEGVQEAKAVLKLVKGKQFEYPIYIDVEDPHHQVKASKQAITDAIKGFCDTMEKAGYYVGFYCNVDWYNNHMYKDQLTQYDRWIASWSKSKPSIANRMWQFGGETNYICSNKIDGIPDNVTDCNYCYYDYPSIMKSVGLNGFTKPVKEEAKQEVAEKPTETPQISTKPEESPITPPKIETNENDAKNEVEKINASLINKILQIILDLLKKIFKIKS